MVLRFTATVKKREVRVRDVDLPDGATVDVTIARQAEDDDFDLTPEQWAEVRKAEREIARGEYLTREEFSAWVRQRNLQGAVRSPSAGSGARRKPRVGAAQRGRAKSAGRRSGRGA